MIEFEVLLEKLGEVGLYQWILFITLSYCNIIGGFCNLSPVFITNTPDYRCNVPPIDNSSIYPNLSENDILNLTTPFDDYNLKYERCYRYNYDLNNCTGDYSCVNKSADTIPCDQGYYFDNSTFTETVVTEFNLVCDRSVYSSLSTSLYYAGMLIGSLIFGPFCDKYGRRKTVLLCFTSSLGCILATAFSYNLTMYIIFRILLAIFSYGCNIGTLVYIMEIVGEDYRTVFGMMTSSFVSMSYMILSGYAYAWRNWHDMMIACCVTGVPFLCVGFFIPESPRWLFTNGRNEEGRKVVNLIEKVNKVKLNEEDWIKAEVYRTEKMPKGTAIDLFKLPKTRLITFNMMFAWFVCSTVYYGLSLNAGALAGDIFLNNALNGALEIPALLISVYLLNKIGRKTTLSLAYFIAGFGLLISLISLEFSDSKKSLETVSRVFAFIGKAGVSASFSIVYNLVAELYPTVTRSNAVGISSVAARIGGFLAPFIISLQDSVRWLPNVIFSCLGITAGLLALLLPETKGFELMETVEEAEEFYKTRKQVKIKRKSFEESCSISSEVTFSHWQQAQQTYQNEVYRSDMM